jgi:hypothetical protein
MKALALAVIGFLLTLTLGTLIHLARWILNR